MAWYPSKAWLPMLCVLLASALGSFEGEQPDDSGSVGESSSDTEYLTREFDSLANFALDIDGMPETAKDEAACREKCLERQSCRSYSWSETGTKEKPGRTCIWSAKYIGFDPDWTFHTRTYAIDASGQLAMTGPFRSFPGMRFVEDRFHSEKTGLTEDECLESCETDRKCMAYSFSPSKLKCLLSDGAVKYAPGFTYYERNQPVLGKKGLFQYYPRPESLVQKREASRKHLMEQSLAQGDDRARKKKLQAEQALALQLQQKAKIKEGTDKSAEKQHEMLSERAAKDAAMRKRLFKDVVDAQERGKYAESVHKAQGNLFQSQVNLSKERGAKNTVAQNQAQESGNKARTKEKEAAVEMALKKKVSKLTADVASTEKVTARLQYEKAARLIQVEAFKLAQKERQSKGKMPPAISKLIFQETQIENQVASRTHTLQQNKKKLQMLDDEKKRLIKVHKQDIRDQQKMHKTQRLLVKMRSEEEIKATKKMVANAGPATRLAALKIQDAREKVQMAKAERLFDNLVGRDVIIVANGTRVCRVADMDKTLEKHLKNPSMTEQWFDQGGGHLICDEEVKQQEMETFLQYRFTVENAGGYPAIGLKVANTPDKPKSGRMCSLDGNGAAEVIKCRSPVPDILGAKLSKPMKLAVKISVSHPGTFSLFPYGTDKVCRLVSSKRDGIVCDEAKPTDPDDPATLFKFLPAESLFEQGKEFVTYDSKRGCDDLEAKLEESELESKACQDRCCANQDCQFITFIPAKQGAKTLPMGQCQLFRNCRALTKRGASAMAEATIFQKTGIGCNKPAADQQEVQALI